MSSFENILYIGLAGFIGVNLNFWLTRLLNRIHFKKNPHYYIPWGLIILNAVAALALGILMNKLDENTIWFQYICVGLIGSIGSSYFFFSNTIFRSSTPSDQKIVYVVRLLGEILLDILFLSIGLQINL